MKPFMYIALVIIAFTLVTIIAFSTISSTLNSPYGGPSMRVSPAPRPPSKIPPLTDVVSAWMFTRDNFKNGVPDWIRQYRSFGHEGKTRDHYRIVFARQPNSDIIYGTLYTRKDLKVLGNDSGQPFRLGDTIDQLRDGSIKIEPGMPEVVKEIVGPVDSATN